MTHAIPPCVPSTDLDGLRLLRRGKVRDVYEVDAAHLLLVSSDRVSAFDYILEPSIPYKGAVLAAISAWYFRALGDRVPTHFVTDDVDAMPESVRRHAALIRGRAALCKRARIVPFECVVRGYLAGSAVKEYERTGAVYGEVAPKGMAAGDRFDAPLFTPTTKAEAGHDEPVSLEKLEMQVGLERAWELKERSIALFNAASDLARTKGLLLVDSKLEWGTDADGKLVLCDEAFTPDSSRYWRVEEWAPGRAPAAPGVRGGVSPPRATTPEPLDKQVVRNWLTRDSGWDQAAGGAPPPLPPDIVLETAKRYLKVHEILTGRKL